MSTTDGIAFTISETERSDARVIAISGELDVATVASLRQLLLQRNGKHRLVVVDLTAVSFIDSTGLSALILGQRQQHEHGADLSLVGLQPQVEKVLEVTGLNEVFPIYDDVEDAMSAKGSEGDGSS